MSFSAPKAPDPVATSNQQQQYNLEAAKSQNATNSYGQTSNYGSINYVPDSSQPSGYRVVQSYSAPEQKLFDTQVGTQATAGQTAQDLLRNTAGMYSQPFNGNNEAVTNKLNQWNAQYLQPIFNQQDSNLEAKLRNQGLTLGTAAYDNAKNLQARNQGDVTTNYLQKNQQQGFDQALQEYQTPLQTISGLYGAAAPTGITPLQTPTSSIQPANYQGAVQNNYQGQVQNYDTTWNNIGKLGTAAVGLAAAPFTGDTSLLASMPGMFGNAANAATGGGWGNALFAGGSPSGYGRG